MLQPFQGSVVSIRRCSHRGRESSGANGVMPKVMPKRSYSVVLCRQGLPTDQGCDCVLRGIPVSVRKTVICITQMTHGPWKGPSTSLNTGISTVTTEGRSQALDKSVDKLPPVMAGMDRAEALAFVSRLYDSAQAGAHSGAMPCWSNGS